MPNVQRQEALTANIDAAKVEAIDLNRHGGSVKRRYLNIWR